MYLKVEVNGRKHHPLRLKQFEYNAVTRRRFQEDEDPVGFATATTSDSWLTPLWIDVPNLNHKFYARWELYDGDTLLAMADTKALPGGL